VELCVPGSIAFEPPISQKGGLPFEWHS
jgi:hypothetical protein